MLRDFSLTVPRGSVTALVGPSGSGKTTVIRLISRFWEAQHGAVRVGGADVRELRTEDLTRQVALVFQDVYLFDDTLEANIRLGRPEATDTERTEAARLVGVDEIIARLPRLAQPGGRRRGGPVRRRAPTSLDRAGPAQLKRAPIVLLDEATAALDPENERCLQRSIRQLAQHSTVLLIAHRLNSVVDAARSSSTRVAWSSRNTPIPHRRRRLLRAALARKVERARLAPVAGPVTRLVGREPHGLLTVTPSR